jgi:hypothetical protein
MRDPSSDQLEAYILDITFDLEIPETKKDEILKKLISSNQSLPKLIDLCKEFHIGFNIHQPFKFSLYGEQGTIVQNHFSHLKKILQQHSIESLDLPDRPSSKKMLGHLLSNQVGPGNYELRCVHPSPIAVP